MEFPVSVFVAVVICQPKRLSTMPRMMPTMMVKRTQYQNSERPARPRKVAYLLKHVLIA